MGRRKRPADTAAVAEWLLTEADQAVGAVVAIDTLAWGGLIPSRQSGNDLGAALRGLDALRAFRRRHPDKPLLAFSSIQRINRDDDDGEEPAYFRSFGKRIFRRSVLEHRSAASALEGEEPAELERLRGEIPATVWEDVLAIRSRTHAVNLAALDLVAEGVLDVLVLNQDDTTTWGLNVQERARLEREVRSRGLGARVFVYPGADEVAQVLIARLAARLRGRRPKVAAFYASRGGAAVQTGYEDRPLGDLVVTHVRAAGGLMAAPAVAPDVYLALNSPSRAQGHGGLALSLAYDEHGLITAEQRAWIEAVEAPVIGLDRSIEAFVDTVASLLGEGQRVSVADVAHTNGADDELMSGLHEAGCLPLLSGYGGWNTAGNALGSAVALGCIASLDVEPAALRRAVTARFLDDWLYQTRVRTRLLLQPELHAFGLGGFIPEHRRQDVADQARAWLDEELAAKAWPFRVGHLALPWQRVFEIDYDLLAVAAAEAQGGQR